MTKKKGTEATTASVEPDAPVEKQVPISAMANLMRREAEFWRGEAMMLASQVDDFAGMNGVLIKALREIDEAKKTEAGNVDDSN